MYLGSLRRGCYHIPLHSYLELQVLLTLNYLSVLGVLKDYLPCVYLLANITSYYNNSILLPPRMVSAWLGPRQRYLELEKARFV